MNIKITHNWLLEYLDTDAEPHEIQKYLSLCGPSVESVEKTQDGDYVYDIEITSNRIDSASVFGIALEAQAILPMFGKKAALKFNPLKKYTFTALEKKQGEAPKVEIQNPDLCSRFCALVVDNIRVQPSPDFIAKRLKAVGIKVINNVVDISNYLMITFGQPTHVFDYDKIGSHTMKMRGSGKGEEIVTLDGRKITLPGGDIVIEDGNGDIIDLCGIMGGLNSSFTENSKRVLLFVQTYNKQRIRKTSMLTGQRTVAATYFEKGLDEERVEAAMTYGVELLMKYADGKIGGELVDIYNKQYKPKHILFNLETIHKKIGVGIAQSQVDHILHSLGFESTVTGETYDIRVPSFRQYDVEIVEDIVEEIARIYGYHNLPNNLSPAAIVKQPPEMEKLFVYQNRIKSYLKHIGLHEVLNYSMISLEMIDSLDLDPEKHLFLSNVMSEDIKYLRTTLLPSLIKNIRTNEGKKDELKLFELAKVYEPRTGNLPVEEYRLCIAVTSGFFDLKGTVEALLRELHIESYSFVSSKNPLFAAGSQAALMINGATVGTLGKLKTQYKNRFTVKSEVFLGELDFAGLVRYAKTISFYKPLHPYSIVKLDRTIELSGKVTYESIKDLAYRTSPFLQNMEVVDIYNNKITVRYYFSSPSRNITEDEAKTELKKMS